MNVSLTLILILRLQQLLRFDYRLAQRHRKKLQQEKKIHNVFERLLLKSVVSGLPNSYIGLVSLGTTTDAPVIQWRSELDNFPLIHFDSEKFDFPHLIH